MSEVDSSRFRVDSLPLMTSGKFGGFPLESVATDGEECFGATSFISDSSLVDSTTPFGGVVEAI